MSIYLNNSFISADTGKSRYILGSYAFGSGALYSFWPVAPFIICDDGGSDWESPCVSSLSSSYYFNNKHFLFKLNENKKSQTIHTRGLAPGLSFCPWWIGGSRENLAPLAASGAK